MNTNAIKHESFEGSRAFSDVDQSRIKQNCSLDSKTLTINNRQIHYSDSGQGEAVVFIHCSTANSRIWKRYMQPGNYRYLAADQWGCGRSHNWAGQIEFGLYEEARPIIKLIRNMDKAVHLVGHSYGGSVALKVAMEMPDAVKKITLIEPSSFHLLKNANNTKPQLFSELQQLADNIENSVRSGNYWEGMASFTNYWNGAGAWEELPFETQLKQSQRVLKVLLDFHALFNEPTTLQHYQTLKHSVQLVYGECSPAPSQKIVQLLSDILTDVQCVCIRGAGHMSPVTHVNEVSQAVYSHLAN